MLPTQSLWWDTVIVSLKTWSVGYFRTTVGKGLPHLRFLGHCPANAATGHTGSE